MGYHIKRIPDEPIIVETWDAHYDPETDAPQAAQDIIRVMETIKTPVVVIVDMRAARLTFDDILHMAQSASNEAAPARHPMQRRRIIVTDNEVISKSAEGLDSEIFGHIAVDIATTMDEALAMARQ